MHVFTIQLSLMSFNWKGKREKLFITAPLRIEYPQLTTEYSYSLPLFFMYWIISSTTTHTKRTNNNKEVKKYQPMQDTTFDVFLGITEKARMVILLVFFFCFYCSCLFLVLSGFPFQCGCYIDNGFFPPILYTKFMCGC